MAEDQRNQVAATFDAAAATYDDVGVDMFQPIARLLVEALGPQPGERALDIGCGKGAATIPLAFAVAPAGSVVGIDISERMVEQARLRARDAGVDVEFRVGDAQEPELPAGQFDVVASSLVLFFLPEPRAALERWRQLLVPGGRVGVTTFGPYSESWRRVDDLLTSALPPGSLDPRTQLKDSPFGSDQGMEQLFGAAGFGEVKTVTATVSIRFTDCDQWHSWSWSQGQRRMWLAIPEAERDEVRARAYEQLERVRMPDGELGFDQQIRITLGRP